ncbi:hypothetical protein C8R45DRAFT_945759 [Mycena sanguinolenta]|nr:hypothetical protein C8R45DRAFT_945759 [Mycena sanguinolenta]
MSGHQLHGLLDSQPEGRSQRSYNAARKTGPKSKTRKRLCGNCLLRRGESNPWFLDPAPNPLETPLVAAASISFSAPLRGIHISQGVLRLQRQAGNRGCTFECRTEPSPAIFNCKPQYKVLKSLTWNQNEQEKDCDQHRSLGRGESNPCFLDSAPNPLETPLVAAASISFTAPSTGMHITLGLLNAELEAASAHSEFEQSLCREPSLAIFIRNIKLSNHSPNTENRIQLSSRLFYTTAWGIQPLMLKWTPLKRTGIAAAAHLPAQVRPFRAVRIFSSGSSTRPGMAAPVLARWKA